MTTISVTKAQIIKAIETEPVLYPGSFIFTETAYGWSIPYDKQDCTVCAVGSVIRNVVSPRVTPREINDIACSNTDTVTPSGDNYEKAQVIKEALAALEDSPLNALSVAFEGFCGSATKRDGLTKRKIERVRRDTIEFVEKYFPPTVLIDINGVKPRDKVKVVKK